MTDDLFLDEHRYAWRLIRTARQSQVQSQPATEQLTGLLNSALDAGLDRTTLLIELAAIGGRLLALCDPIVDDEICLT